MRSGTFTDLFDARHSLFVGKTKTGKSAALIHLALNEIHNGNSIVFIDPKGSAIDEILSHIPRDRHEDVLLFEPSSSPFAFNNFANVPLEFQPLLAGTILETIRGLYFAGADSTPNVDKFFLAGIQTLLKVPDTSLISLLFLLIDSKYRKKIKGHLKDSLLRYFWDDFESMSLKDMRAVSDSSANKLWAFTLEPLVRECIDQKDNRLILKDKIVLVSLRQGKLGTKNTNLLGALVLSHVLIEGLQDLNTTLYVDGAQFATSVLTDIMGTCPNVTAHLAIQYLDQLDYLPVLGSVGQIVALRSSVADSKILSPEFNLSAGEHKLYELHPFVAYVARDGVTTETALQLHGYPLTHQERKIRERCVSQCTAPREVVKKRIERYL